MSCRELGEVERARTGWLEAMELLSGFDDEKATVMCGRIAAAVAELGEG
ncbi:hypothetical protein [Rhizohabitans arisaemae]|nr:hypothetical protein [Rhizohabitans arisaemae]